MKRFRFCYPGDQPVTCVEYTREEFLKAHPRTPTRIYSGRGLEAEIPTSPDSIICDYCSAYHNDPNEPIYVVGGNRGYCQKCAEETVLPHCVVLVDKDERFNSWMARVDRILSVRCGMASADLPDRCYRDMFDNGDSPHAAASDAIEAAGY